MEPRPEELAAMVAAIERFLADTAPPPAAPSSPAPPGPWLRAARHEAVGETDPRAVW